MDNLSLNSKIKLNNGVFIPRLGFGTWELESQSVFDPVKWAIDVGYRLIDTAAIYANEKFVGKAIKDSKIPRDEIFITSKVWNRDQGYEKTIKAFNASLERLELDFIDLYLIHWPNKKLSVETWRALEKIYNEGGVKAIGVSNFTTEDLKSILGNYEVVPTINQIKMHPLEYLKNKELVDFCNKKGIIIEAYSPLTHGENLDNNRFQEIAQKYNKSVPQILIRWSLQHNFVCIPRSASKEHIEENVSIFDFRLTEQDMKKLDSI